MTGTYIACKYSADTTRKLVEWANFLKIPNVEPAEKLHSTILFSRAVFKEEDEINLTADQLGKMGWVFVSWKLDLFDDRSNGTACLVVRLIAPQLEELHEQLIAKGGTHDFDTFDPHVTISKSVPADIDLGRLYPPSIHLIPTRIYTEPLDLT